MGELKPDDLDQYLDEIEPEKVHARDFYTALRFIRPFVASRRSGLGLLGTVLLGETAVNLSFPLISQHMIDQGLLKQDWSVVTHIILLLACAALAISCLGLAVDYLSTKISVGIVHDLRNRLFQQLQRLPLPFFDRRPAGTVLSRFSADIALVEAALIATVPWFVVPLLEVTYSVPLLVYFNPLLAILGSSLFPLTLLVPRVFTRRAFALSYEKRGSEGTLLSKVQENVSSQRVVKAFGLQRRYQSAFDRQSSDWGITAFRMHFASALVERSAYVGVCFVHLAVLGLGAYWTFKGDMTLGTLVAFEAVLVSMGYALTYCTQYIPTLAQGVGSVQHLDDLLAEKPEGRDAPDLPVLPKLSRNIVFRKVLFRYPGSRFSLRIDETEIQKGTFVAVVGPSGSGKSTIFNLLVRFYDPNEGAILFDGQDIRNFTKSSLQGQIGAVFQDNLLMNSSIMDNIRIGKEDASDAEVRRAAQLAEVHESIQGLAQGYDTVVGESGAQLSGGQCQRLAIARALVRDPPILILDEATSALDHQTEAALNATLRRLATSRVVISITHRIGSIHPSDRVLVMDRGNLTESGTHRELIQTDSFYGSYWRKHRSITTPDGNRTAPAISAVSARV